MHQMIGFVGPSGTGKTLLIDTLLEQFPDQLVRIRSLTTRPRRGPEDDVWYRFVTPAEIDAMEAAGELIQRSEYAGHSYANHRHEIDALLEQRIGIMPIVEQGVLNFRNAGYQVDIIRIIPRDRKNMADATRQQADLERARIALPAILEIENSFLPGGKERAIEQLIEYLKTSIFNG